MLLDSTFDTYDESVDKTGRRKVERRGEERRAEERGEERRGREEKRGEEKSGVPCCTYLLSDDIDIDVDVDVCCTRGEEGEMNDSVRACSECWPPDELHISFFGRASRTMFGLPLPSPPPPS